MLGLSQRSSLSKGKHRAVILLSVSWIILILSLVLMSHLQQMEITFEEQRIARTDLHLRFAARSALNMVMAGMADDAVGNAQEGKEPQEGAELQKGKESFDAYTDAWGWESVKEKFGKDAREIYPDVDIGVSVEDEDSKVNLKETTPERLGMLLHMAEWPELSAKQAAEAAIELTSEVEQGSGESATAPARSEAGGGSQDSSGVFDLRYLMRLPGFPPEILYGEDLNFNGQLDPNENDGSESFPRDDRNGSLRQSLFRFVTLWGDGKVNPNLAPYEVLMTVPGISRQIAEEICRRRQGQDSILGTDDDLVFESMKDLQELSSVSRFDELEYRKMAPFMRTSSSCYTVRVCTVSRATGQMFRVQTCVKREEKGKIRTLGYLEDTGF